MTGAGSAGVRLADHAGESPAARQTASTWPFWSAPALVSLAYSGLALWAFWPLYPGDPNRLLFRADADPGQHVWFFAWFAHALVTGHNPLWTSAVNVPYGVNLAQETGMPLLALLTLPITLTAGAVSSVALCTVAAMPLSAMSACWVLRRWKVWWPAAALGGLAYGFSPFVLVQGVVHLDLIFLVLPPLIVAAIVELVRGAKQPRLTSVALALLIAGQYFISGEILAITLVVSAAGLFLSGLYILETDRFEAVQIGRRIIRPLLESCGLVVLLLGYPVWFQFEGPHHYIGPPWPVANPWHGDALGFVAATPYQHFRPVLAGTGTLLTDAVGDENGMYIGAAVIVVSGFLLVMARASMRARLTFALVCASGLLSLGSHLQVDKRQTSVPLPFDALLRLPGSSGILPIRFSFATGACLAAFIAFALDEIRKSRTGARPPRLARNSATLAGVLCGLTAGVLVFSWLPASRYSTHPVRLLPRAIERAIPAGDPIVLAYPYPLEGATGPMVWQANDLFRFRLLGVYALVPGPTGRATEIPPLLQPAGVQELLVSAEGGWGYADPPRVTQVVSELDHFLEANHVRVVIVDDRAVNGTAIGHLIKEGLGVPAIYSGGFEIWNV